MTVDRNSAGSSNVLGRLWVSTLSLYNRFNLTPIPQGSRRLVAEENMEVQEASTRLETLSATVSKTALDYLKENLAGEIADNIVVLMGLALAHNIPLYMIYDQIEATIAKNDAKNHETHTVVDGKIRRVRM